MAAPVVRDERGRFKATRHPCTVGKAKAKAGKPGKVNAAKTKKARVASAKSTARRHKAHAKASKTAAKTTRGRVAAAKTAVKQGSRAKVAAGKPC